MGKSNPWGKVGAHLANGQMPLDQGQEPPQVAGNIVLLHPKPGSRQFLGQVQAQIGQYRQYPQEQ